MIKSGVQSTDFSRAFPGAGVRSSGFSRAFPPTRVRSFWSSRAFSVALIFLLASCAPALSRARSVNPAQASSTDPGSKAYTPPAGSPERKAMMDALRGDQKVVFKVNYLKVHGDWAWADVTPLENGKAVAEGGANLLHRENGVWKVMDLSVIPEDPDNPMGPDDPDRKFVRAAQKAFPGLPTDIFPPRKSGRRKSK